MTLEITWDDIKYELDARLKSVLLDTLQFDKVMPIQKACIPIFSKNYDVAVEVNFHFLLKHRFLTRNLGCHWIRKDPILHPPCLAKYFDRPG
jgi:hypothetical protein